MAMEANREHAQREERHEKGIRVQSKVEEKSALVDGHAGQTSGIDVGTPGIAEANHEQLEAPVPHGGTGAAKGGGRRPRTSKPFGGTDAEIPKRSGDGPDRY